jgi:hypothetical protein
VLDARLSPKVPEAKWLISNGLQLKVGFEGKTLPFFQTIWQLYCAENSRLQENLHLIFIRA